MQFINLERQNKFNFYKLHFSFLLAENNLCNPFIPLKSVIPTFP